MRLAGLTRAQRSAGCMGPSQRRFAGRAPDHSGQVDALDAVGGARAAVRAGLDLRQQVDGARPVSSADGEQDLCGKP